MTWGYNGWRAGYQNGAPYWHQPNTYSIVYPGDLTANWGDLYVLIYWKAPQRGSARTIITHKNWAWNDSQCGDGSVIALVHQPNENTFSGTTLQQIGIGNLDTSLKTIDQTRQVNAGEALMYYMYGNNTPCNDDANVTFTVTLTPN